MEKIPRSSAELADYNSDKPRALDESRYSAAIDGKPTN